MEYKNSFTARFTLHLQEIGDHIATSSPSSALRWIEELERQVHRLSKFPEGHAPARENKNCEIELRQMLYGKGRHQYRVIFTIRQREIIVLDVRHGAREAPPPKSFE